LEIGSTGHSAEPAGGGRAHIDHGRTVGRMVAGCTSDILRRCHTVHTNHDHDRQRARNRPEREENDVAAVRSSATGSILRPRMSSISPCVYPPKTRIGARRLPGDS
jgi:hypothetical protein